jgi:hypothetical protein
MISTIHEATIVNTGQKGRKTNIEIKKPYVLVQYDKFMKGIDRSDQYQYLSYYSVLRKTVKLSEICGTVSSKLCSLQRIFCEKDTKYKQKLKYKNFLHEVGRSWITEVQDRSESNSDDLQLPEKQTTPRGPNQDLPGRHSSDFRIYKLENFWWWGGKTEILYKTV